MGKEVKPKKEDIKPYDRPEASQSQGMAKSRTWSEVDTDRKGVKGSGMNEDIKVEVEVKMVKEMMEGIEGKVEEPNMNKEKDLKLTAAAVVSIMDTSEGVDSPSAKILSFLAETQGFSSRPRSMFANLVHPSLLAVSQHPETWTYSRTSRRQKLTAVKRFRINRRI